jgi:hypothetical protein
MLVVLDKLRSRDLAVKLTAMLLVCFLFQQMMPRKARRNSLDEQAYMKGLIQLLKYPSQNAKLNRPATSQVGQAASTRIRSCHNRKYNSDQFEIIASLVAMGK